MLNGLRRIIIGYQSATSRTAEKGFPPVERRRDRIDAVATRLGQRKSFYPVIFGDSIHSSYARSRLRASGAFCTTLARSAISSRFNDVIEEP